MDMKRELTADERSTTETVSTDTASASTEVPATEASSTASTDSEPTLSSTKAADQGMNDHAVVDDKDKKPVRTMTMDELLSIVLGVAENKMKAKHGMKDIYVTSVHSTEVPEYIHELGALAWQMFSTTAEKKGAIVGEAEKRKLEDTISAKLNSRRKAKETQINADKEAVRQQAERKHRAYLQRVAEKLEREEAVRRGTLNPPRIIMRMSDGTEVDMDKMSSVVTHRGGQPIHAVGMRIEADPNTPPDMLQALMEEVKKMGTVTVSQK